MNAGGPGAARGAEGGRVRGVEEGLLPSGFWTY